MILVKSTRLSDNRYSLTGPYSEAFNEIARSLPGLIWDAKSTSRIGYSDSVSILARKLNQERIGKVTGELPTTVSSLSLLDDDNVFKLYEYQKHGVAFLKAIAGEGALLSDQTGLGKTLSTLVALQSMPLPAIIVCPAIVKREWVKEGARIGIDVLSLSGVKPPKNIKLSKSDGIIVINYDIIYAWLDILKYVPTIVFDECHNLIETKSRRSKVCKEIAHAAKNRIALSATPYTSRPIQLWNVVDTISPGRFGHYLSFGKKYANGFQEEIPDRKAEGSTRKVWNLKGASNIEELNERLSSFMLRRTKAEVAMQLPLITRQMIEVDVPSQSIHSVIPQDVDDKWMRWALSISAKGKIDQAVELVKTHLINGSSIVVTSHRHEIANEIQRELLKNGIEPYMATGEKTIDNRIKAMKEAAQHTPCVIIVTTHAVGEGINELVFADVAIVVELDYVPRWLIQFEGRLHRTGQRRNVLVQYLIGLGTLDEVVRDRVLGKLATFEQVIGSSGDTLGADLAGGASEEELLAELRDALREMAA